MTRSWQGLKNVGEALLVQESPGLVGALRTWEADAKAVVKVPVEVLVVGLPL